MSAKANRAKTAGHMKPKKEKKPVLVFVLSFLLPVLIMIGIFAAKGIYPFGDNSFLRTDLYHQYAPFFSEFLDKLQNGGSLLYSWNIGMGTNFLALFAYYLASPFNWLLFLCPRGALIEFMSYLIVIKIGLCGLSFAWYLNRRGGDKRQTGIALFACAYALSGYLAAYSWNIMWLDCIILAPLILLGLERLVKEDKCLLYCVTLAMAILSNYYISIMICLFLIFYFIVQMILLPTHTVHTHTGLDGSQIRTKKRTKYGKKIFHFCLYSLIAGGLAAVLLIPEIKMLTRTASGSSRFPTSFSSYFPVFDMLARHFINVTCEIGLEHWPNLYCGVAVLFLFPLYIMNKKVPFKEKVAGGALLLFMLLSFSLNIPNFIWHGFHYPNSLPCRQSFLYTAVLLTMCYDGFKDLRRFSVKQIVTGFWIAAAFILLAEKLVDVEDFVFYNYYITFIFVGLFALMAYLYKTGKAMKGTLLILAFSLLAIELTVNTAVTSVTLTSRSAYLKNYDDYRTLTDHIRKEDPSFYRMEKDDSTRKTKDDGAWLNYPSTSIFSSVANDHVASFFKKFGMESSVNAYGFNGATPVTASLLGVKYIFSTDTDLARTAVYKPVKASGEIGLYENPFALPVGYLISSQAYATLRSPSGNPIEVQNQFLKTAAGVSDVFTAVWGSSSGTSYQFSVPESGYVYVYSTNTAIDKITAKMGGESKTFSNTKRGYVLNLGYCASGLSVQLSTEEEEYSVSAVAYQLNEDAYQKAMNKLAEQSLVVDRYDDTSLAGHVTAREDGCLLVTIPFEEGWTVKVDGSEVEPQSWMDAYFAIPLKAGSHSIEFSFVPAGLAIGAKISFGSLLLLIAVSLIGFRFRKYQKEKTAEKPARLPKPRAEASPSGAAEGEIDHVITIDDLPGVQAAADTENAPDTVSLKKDAPDGNTPENNRK
ncbi:MAG: YfhO family protein [Lachnospiraceae bacterium]|nr:YfhO family protein [Lachnospiraceae bacterium]